MTNVEIESAFYSVYYVQLYILKYYIEYYIEIFSYLIWELLFTLKKTSFPRDLFSSLRLNIKTMNIEYDQK